MALIYVIYQQCPLSRDDQTLGKAKEREPSEFVHVGKEVTSLSTVFSNENRMVNLFKRNA